MNTVYCVSVVGFFVTFLCLSLLNTFFLPYLSFPFIPLIDFGFRVNQCNRQIPDELCLSVICWKLLLIWLVSLPCGLQISSSLLNPTSVFEGSDRPLQLCSVLFWRSHFSFKPVYHTISHISYRIAYSSSLSWMVYRLRLCLQCTQTVFLAFLFQTFKSIFAVNSTRIQAE